MKKKKLFIMNILKSNLSLFCCWLIGMLLSDIYIEYSLYNIVLDGDSTILASINRQYGCLLVTVVLLIGYSFVLMELIKQQQYEISVLFICGFSKRRIIYMFIKELYLLWLIIFLFSGAVFLFIIRISYFNVQGYIQSIILSFIFQSLLNLAETYLCVSINVKQRTGIT